MKKDEVHRIGKWGGGCSGGQQKNNFRYEVGGERMRTNSQLALWFREVLMPVSGGPVGEGITLAQLAEVPPT